MKDFIELNAEIEKIYNPNIEFYHDYNNILLNGKWVNETNLLYFAGLENSIKNKINLIPDLENKNSNKLLKIFYQDVLGKYQTNLNKKFNNLDELKKIMNKKMLFSEIITKAPTYPSSELIHHDPVSYEYVLGRLVQLYELGSYDDFMNGETLDSTKQHIEDTILEKYNINIKNNIIEEDSYAIRRIEKCYAYTHLSNCLDSLNTILRNIAEYLEYLLNFIEKINSDEDDKLNLTDIYDNDPTNIKLEYKINKMEIAFFYKVLHDSGIIFVDNKNQKHPYTNLKKYIDKSNIYYLENKKVEKVKLITKEFAKINKHNLKVQEIKILELISSKLNNRIEELLADKEEGIL